MKYPKPIFKKNILIALFSFVVGTVLYLYGYSPRQINRITSEIRSVYGSADSEEAWISRVVDGDTVQLDDGRYVRYIGINTPELTNMKAGTECYAREAYLFNRNLVANKKVRLEKDVSDQDRYGRLLRYVYADKVMINMLLVEQGYAQVATYPPDVKHQTDFLQAERDARSRNKGLWNECGK